MTGEGEARATDGPVQDQDRFAVDEPFTNGSESDTGAKRVARPNGSSATEARAGATSKTHAGAYLRTPDRPSPKLGRINPKPQPDRAMAGADPAHPVEPFGPEHLGARRDLSIRYPSAALEPAAALLGWLSIALLGVAELATKLAHHRIAVVVPWLAVFLAGSVVSVLLAARRRSALGVRRLLAEVQRRYPPVTAVDAKESSRRADEFLADLLDRTASFVGARAAALYVVTAGSDRPTLRTSVGMDLTSQSARTAIDVAMTEGRPMATAEDSERTWMVLSAPLVIGDRVTGIIVVSAPRRWSRTRRLSRLQQTADACAAVIERARLGEEEWRNRLGVAHARGHLAILAEAAVTLSTGVDSTDESFLRLGRVIVPDFADWFAVHLDEGSGQLSSVSVGNEGVASRRQHGAHQRQVQQDSPEGGNYTGGHLHPDGEALVRSAMATGGAVVSSDLAAGCAEPGRQPGTEPALSLMQASPTKEIGSLMVVPLEIRGRPVGALSFVTFPGRRGFRPSDLEAAGTLAGTVAATAERMLLFRQGKALSASADRRADRLRRLVETALVVSTPLSEHEVLQVLAEHARRVLGCERVVVTSRRHGFTVEMSCPPDPSDLEVEAVHDATDRVLGGSRSAQESSSMGVASFRVTEAESTTSPDWVAAPVDHATGTVGRAMVALGTGPEPFGPDDEAVLALLARMASVALERAALYETLRSNEQRLTVLVESSPLAIAELDLDGTVRWWNRAAGYLFGWDESGLAPRAIPVTGEAALMLDALWDRARLGLATVGALVPARRPGGELMELSLSVAPLEETDGSTGGILAVAEDATEREQVLEQFHRSQRLGAMARLAGGIAHDFNNLVTVILASSETLMRRIGTDDPMRAEVEAIHRVGRRAAALTGQLLQIGQRSSLQLVETDTSEVITAMSDDLRRLFGPHVDVEITADKINSPLLVLVDRAELERAVLNLAFNARDAMPQGGRLVVDTRLARDEKGTKCWVVISMSDTGIGMDPSTAEHCFEPFFTTKGSASGTGLGLATVHAIVTQSNGSVNVESTPGAGTTFTLRFPFAGKPAVTAELSAARAQASKR